MKLKPGMKVLDIGSGTGGSAFYLARRFGVEVLGLDLSSNMLAIANEHKSTMEKDVQDLVTFRYLDATLAAFPSGTFDLVYSRDAIMHIAEKQPLYTKILVISYSLLLIIIDHILKITYIGLAQTGRRNSSK